MANKLSELQKKEIKELFVKGNSITELANLFQFSNTAPASGEIRAFFITEIDNTKTVRALTVSNSSKNAIDVVPTLRQLQDIRLLVTGSGGHRTFTALNVVQKAGYFFVDNVDLPFATVSESINSEVTFGII